MEALGALVRRVDGDFLIKGNERPRGTVVDCGESGATLRFITAVSATMPDETLLVARGRLAERPLLPLTQSLAELGASIRIEPFESGLNVSVQGPLQGGDTTVTGQVSSQFVSGLLFASPLAKRDVTLNVEGRVVSSPYIDMTLRVLESHGITVREHDGQYQIPAPQTYNGSLHAVPGDYSSAANLLVAGAVAGDEIEVLRLDPTSRLEPDSVIVDLLSQAGLRVKIADDAVSIEGDGVEAFEFDASDHPDLVPILEVLASHAKGTSVIKGVGRLSLKESDRLSSVPSELRKMGARIEVGNDSVTITGGSALAGARLSSHNDHRVAMACTVASLNAEGSSEVEDAGVVSKSYPDFYKDLTSLGAELSVQ